MTHEVRSGYRSEEDLVAILGGLCFQLTSEVQDEAAIDSAMTQLQDHLAPSEERAIMHQAAINNRKRLGQHFNAAYFAGRLSQRGVAEELADDLIGNPDARDVSVLFSFYKDGTIDRDKLQEAKPVPLEQTG